MKIESNPSILNFTIPDAISKQSNSIFENYLRSAILELERTEAIRKNNYETIRFLTDQIRFSLDIMERISRTPVDSSLSSTVGDFLLAQAFELEKIADSLPEGALKTFFKESALYIGIEAEKIRRGFYRS